jgi:hypothetical protein
LLFAPECRGSDAGDHPAIDSDYGTCDAARSLARKAATSAYSPETAAPAKHQRGLSSKPKIHTKFLVTP